MPLRLGPTGAPGISFKGDWVSGAAYAVNDVVRNVGQTFVVLTGHTAGSTFEGGKFAPLATHGDYGAAFYPRDYGAKEDGATDDTAAWTKLIAALKAAGRGAILLTGMSLCAPGVIGPLPAFTSVLGQGAQTGIQWATDGNGNSLGGDYLVDASGTDANNVVGFNTFKDFTLSGGPPGGHAHLLRAYYNAHSVFENLRGDSASVGFADFVQLWDARIKHIQLDYCGTGENSNAIWLRNSGAASGFGYSYDTINQVFIDGVRAEDTFGTIIRIEQGPNNGNPPNGIWIDNVKAETNNAISQPLIYIGPGTTGCFFSNFYLSLNRRASGSAVIDGIVNLGAGNNAFANIIINQNASGLMASPIRHSSSGVDSYRNVAFSAGNYSGAPSDNCVINILAGAPRPVIEGWVGSIYAAVPLLKNGCPVLVAPAGATSVTSTNLLGSDTSLRLDASNGALNVNLPLCSATIGKPITLVRLDNGPNVITVTAASGEQINGRGYVPLEGLDATLVLVPTDDGWHITASTVTAMLWRLRVRQDGDPNNPACMLQGESDPSKQLLLGFDTNANRGFVQSIWQAHDYSPLELQPLGGRVNHTPPTFATNADAAAAGLADGDWYQSNGAVCVKATPASNAVVQRAFGRSANGRVVYPVRLPRRPAPGNHLIGFYSGFWSDGNGSRLIAPPSTSAALLDLVSDNSNQGLGISLVIADTISIGTCGAVSLGDACNVALYEVAGLATRSVTHGACSVSGTTLSIPIPAAPASTLFLLHVQNDNPTGMPQSIPAGITLVSGFSAWETGGGHHAAQLEFAGTGSAFTLQLTYAVTPNTPVFGLLALSA